MMTHWTADIIPPVQISRLLSSLKFHVQSTSSRHVSRSRQLFSAYLSTYLFIYVPTYTALVLSKVLFPSGFTSTVFKTLRCILHILLCAGSVPHFFIGIPLLLKSMEFSTVMLCGLVEKRPGFGVHAALIFRANNYPLQMEEACPMTNLLNLYHHEVIINPVVLLHINCIVWCYLSPYC